MYVRTYDTHLVDFVNTVTDSVGFVHSLPCLSFPSWKRRASAIAGSASAYLCFEEFAADVVLFYFCVHGAEDSPRSPVGGQIKNEMGV